MRILLTHITNTYNYGSMMMAENIITYINKFTNQENEYYTDCNTKEDIERLKQATGCNSIQKDKIIYYSVNSKMQKLKRIIMTGRNNKKASKYYDFIIVLGGDDFSEIYMQNILQRFLVAKEILDLKKLNNRNNVIMLGQTIGPYTGIRKILAKKIFKHIKLYTRDDINLKEMKKEYNIDANSSRDLAFLNLAKQNEYQNKKDEILQKYSLKENEYIVIVGTQLIDKYTNNTNQFVNTFREMIETIKKENPTKKLVWLSHVTTEPEELSDNYLLNLLNKNEQFANKNMIVIKEKMLPVEARIILGNSRYVITCRMHAAVSTFQMGKPAICLSYSPKYKGVIADGLHLQDLVIEAKNDKLWEKQLINIVEEKTRKLENDYCEYLDRINKEVSKSKEIALSTIKEIVQEMTKE